MRVSPFRYS